MVTRLQPAGTGRVRVCKYQFLKWAGRAPGPQLLNRRAFLAPTTISVSPTQPLTEDARARKHKKRVSDGSLSRTLSERQLLASGDGISAVLGHPSFGPRLISPRRKPRSPSRPRSKATEKVFLGLADCVVAEVGNHVDESLRNRGF
jgi:hypothetical protein